ncbi:MAG: hypothetical protein LAP87_10830 [Acidobacteriia bacterium]|nr:hypothetical protein [Terriglobia bacterium]
MVKSPKTTGRKNGRPQPGRPVSKLGKQPRKLAEECAASGGKLLNRRKLEREIAERRGLRVFLCSPFVHLETTPKALFNKRSGEHRFYQTYFPRATMTNDLKLILGHGFREAAMAGVGPMEALHLVAAHLLRADEFIMTEKPDKSVHRSSLVKVVCLFS